jgi:competence protein ComEA
MLKKNLSRILALGALALALTLSAGVAQAAGKAAPAGKVNVNTASVEQLAALPGIGETLAARIVEHRQKQGAFRSTSELVNVKGIGEKSFQKLQPYLTVGEAPAPKTGGSR